MSLLAGEGPTRGFARGVALLATGSAGGQAIAILVSPILARLYAPADFGTYGVYLALVSIVAVAAALRYEAALPLPSDEQEAIELLVLCTAITLGLSLAGGVVVWLVQASGAVRIAPEFALLAWLMPVGVFLTGIQGNLTFWAIRRREFRASGQSSVVQAATQGASQLALTAIGGGSVSLAAGYILARLAGIARLASTLGAQDWRAARRVSWRRLRAVAGVHRRFPMFALWASLLSAISAQTPILVLAVLFNATVVGWFSITVRVLQLPSTIIGSAVGQVLYARVVRTDLADVARASGTMFRALLMLGAGPMWLLAFGGETAFTLVFGESWREAGRYAQWLAPWLLADFVATPLLPLAYVRDRQATLLAFQGLAVSARVGALVLGAVLGGPDVSMVLFAVVSCLLLATLLFWLLRIGGVGSVEPLRWLSRELLVGVVLALPLLAVTTAALPPAIWIAVAALSLAVMLLRSGRQMLLSVRATEFRSDLAPGGA
jgi:O-antigen/teichoic acid export membrane protein